MWEWANGGSIWDRVSVTAEECPRITAEYLDEERQKGEDYVRQEFFCEFVDVDSCVFSRDLLERALDDELVPLVW